MIYDWSRGDLLPAAVFDGDGIELNPTICILDTETGEVISYIRDGEGSFVRDAHNPNALALKTEFRKLPIRIEWLSSMAEVRDNVYAVIAEYEAAGRPVPGVLHRLLRSPQHSQPG